jgi:hypothetical protein
MDHCTDRRRGFTKAKPLDQWCHFLGEFSWLRMVLKNIEIRPEPPGNQLSEYIFKNSVRGT